MTKRKQNNDDGMDIPAVLKIPADKRKEAWDRHTAKRVADGLSPYTSSRTADGSDKPLRPFAPINAPKVPMSEETKQKLREAKAERKPKRPERPTGTFTLAEWAKEAKIEPRVARAIARSLKASLSKHEVNGMKYVYHVADKAKIATAIKATIEAKEKAPSKTSDKRSPASTKQSSSSPVKTAKKTTPSKSATKQRSPSKTQKRTSKKR